MARNTWRLRIVAVFCLLGAGCSTPPVARYVYQDGDYGVIGIPRNTPLGKKDFREQADELMLRHFPDGFEIVRAEEVVEGERTLDTAMKRELETEPGFMALNQAFKLGKLAKSSSFDQKDITHITESRIIYKRKDLTKPTGHDGYSLLTSLGPKLYLDPNESARKLNNELLLAAAKKVDEKDKDAKDKENGKEKIVAEAKSKDGSVRITSDMHAN